MEQFVMAKIMGKEAVPIGKDVTLFELAVREGFSYEKCGREKPVVLARVNNELQGLHRRLAEDCEVEFLNITDPNGFRTYQRSLTFLMICAAKAALGKCVRIVVAHSINNNQYCEIHDENIVLTDDILKEIEDRMKSLSMRDLPIERISMPIGEALALAREFDLADKVNYLKYRRTANVNFYKLDGFYGYFYGPMVPSTKYLHNFELIKSGDGFFLRVPSPAGDGSLCEMQPVEKTSKVFIESSQWARILKADNVGPLNDIISAGKVGDFIRVVEALHEKKIAEIADMIHRENKNIVMIAGPSSSGKTTFAERLCIQLRVNGMRPYIISLDNYFLGRENVPLDEFGQPDFEALSYMDIPQLNANLTGLLRGETVELPTFNFLTGRQEYKGRYMKLYPGEVLVLEGIHGLNEELTPDIPRESKFKIFISALTQLNIDDHNRIPTTDTRILRRIVRDNRLRGNDAKRTISMWPSVLRGEVRNIFPFQEEADAMFNSALVYEMCVLKQYAEPLLFRIDNTSPEYTEARRLIKFLDSFLSVGGEEVPRISILREFIGGGCFHV